MGLKFIDTSLCKQKLKCTIQSSGKLGFPAGTAEAIQLEKGKYVKFAQDDENKDVLYMVFVAEEDEQTLKVAKAGVYYYVPTQAMFDLLKYDYKTWTYIFDLSRESALDCIAGGIVYRMSRRKTNKKKEVRRNNGDDL